MKKKRSIWVLCLIAVACLAGIIFALIQWHPASGDQTSEDMMEIHSRYHVFSYPKVWENNLRVAIEEKTAYTVAFYGVINEKEQHLFDLVFGETPEGKLGVLRTGNNQEVAVGIVTYDVAAESQWRPEELEVFYAMQDDINVILQNMPLVMETPEPTVGQQETEMKDLLVETPYGDLRYPGKWADYITVQKTDGQIYSVTFFASGEGFENYRLFDVFFGGQEGIPMGQLVREDDLITVRISTYEAKTTEGLSDSAVQTICAMQDDVNVLMSELLQRSDESTAEEQIVNPQVPVGDAEEDIVVETEYCRLHFPLKWEEVLQVENMTGKNRIVDFYGQLSPEKRQKLFSVGFDVAEGTPVGTISDGNGNSVTVSVILVEFVPGADWTKEEADIIYEMQEAVNYLIQKLPLT